MPTPTMSYSNCLKRGAVLTSISLWMYVTKEFDFKNVYGEDWEMK